MAAGHFLDRSLQMADGHLGRDFILLMRCDETEKLSVENDVTNPEARNDQLRLDMFHK